MITNFSWGEIDTEKLIFSLNVTMPIFFIMVLGYLLHQKTRLLNDSFAGYLNTFVFQIALPVQLFSSLSQSDFHTGFLLYGLFGLHSSDVLPLSVSA